MQNACTLINVPASYTFPLIHTIYHTHLHVQLASLVLFMATEDTYIDFYILSEQSEMLPLAALCDRRSINQNIFSLPGTL